METQRLQEIVGGFKGKRILVIGDVVIDHYVYGRVERLNPEAPVPILEAQDEKEMTGGAGNVAKNAAMLGADTTLIGVVGNDAGADRYEALAKGEGYQVVCIRDLTRPTIRKVRHIVRSQQLLRVDYEKTHNISPEVEEEVKIAIDNAMEKGIDGIIVSDYAKGTITEAISKKIMEVKEKYNVPVAADIKPSRAPYFVGVSFISPNRKEAHEILGVNQHEQGGQDPAKLAHMLQEKMKSDVYVTLSENGVYVLTLSGYEVHVPQDHVVEVFDPSGAGDTAVTALLLSLLSGAKPQEAAEVANGAGAVVVGKVGSVGLTTDELLSMMTHHHDASHT